MSIEQVRTHPDEDESDGDEFVDAIVDEEQEIDRGLGSGSLSREDAWAAKVSSRHGGPNDGRYETRTTFFARDAETKGPSQLHRDPSERRSWDDLAQWNDGLWDPGRSQANFEADVRRWVETFCTHLCLPEYQAERVSYVVDDVSLGDFKHRQLSAEMVILAVISLVVDVEVDADTADDWTIDDWIVYDDDFVDLMDDVEMDRSDLWPARQIVLEQSDFFDTVDESGSNESIPVGAET